jgi:hypothetical protein
LCNGENIKFDKLTLISLILSKHSRKWGGDAIGETERKEKEGCSDSLEREG